MPRVAPALLGIGSALAGLGAVVAAVARHRRVAGLGLHPVETVRTEAGTLRHHRGDLPIRQRVFLIQQHVSAGIKDPRLRKLALGITRHCPPRDGECEARAIFDWMTEPTAQSPHGRIRYTGDVGKVVLDPELSRPGKKAEAVDLYQGPLRTIEYGGGDCDDHTALASTLAALNGIDAEMDVSSNECKTDDHIFAVARLPKHAPMHRVPLDTTLGAGAFGTWPRYCSKVTFPV